MNGISWLGAMGLGLANHLWQSTAVVVVAAGLAVALRKNQARGRYWIWMVASLKFVLPFVLLAGVASHWVRPRAVGVDGNAGVLVAVEDVSEPFGFEVGKARRVGVVDPTRDGEAVTNGAPGFVMAGRVADPTHDGKAVTNGAPDFVARVVGVLPVVWLVGFVGVVGMWAVRWQRVARVMRAAVAVDDGREMRLLRRAECAAGLRRPIELRVSTTSMEPGVFGIWRPVLAWPVGISQRLDDAQLEAVLTHEVCHVRRRDNLTAALHMFVEAVFWFHPMVWWVGSRLVEERERACDEEVLELCGRPQVYAESILKVCEFCVESPLVCVAGVTGADLKQRVIEIMTERVVKKLTLGKKLLLVAAGMMVVAVPIVLGQAQAARRMVTAALKSAPRPVQFAAHAMIAEEETLSEGEVEGVQADAPAIVPTAAAADAVYVPTMTFDVASVRESKRDGNAWFAVGGGFEPPNSSNLRLENYDLMNLILMAYEVNPRLIEGIPHDFGWATFNIEAKSDAETDERLAKLSKDEVRLEQQHMMQVLLAERFKLKAHRETRDGPTYDLVVAKAGRLQSSGAGPSAEELKRFGDRPIPPLYQQGDSRTGFHYIAHGASTAEVTAMLAMQFGHPVSDKTGLTGKYDFDLKYYQTKASERKDDERNPWSPLETAIQDQLGLKLVASHGPVQMLVIDHVEKPASVDGAEVSQTVSPVQVAQAGVVVSAGPGAAAVGVKVTQEEEAIAKTIVFDVASFRVNNANSPGAAFEMPSNGDGFTMLNRPMRDIIRIAYEVTSGANLHFANEPAWINEVKWDIRAKVAPESLAAWQKLSQSGKKMALRKFDTDYLKLRTHPDMTPYTYYNLTVDKKGPKMAEAKADDTFRSPRGLMIPPGGVMWTGPGEIAGHAGTTTQLSIVLSGHTPYVVHDETGLTEVYNFAISYSPSSIDDPRGGMRRGGRAGYVGDDGPSLFTAVQELGLKLVATKGPLEGIVVDHVERPPEN